MATGVNGSFFERVQILVNNQIIIDSGGLFRVSVSGDEQANPVNTFSPGHQIAGVTRGNGQYRASYSNYIRYSTVPFDWRGVDYDTQVVNISFLCPSSNYGTNNVFNAPSNYLMLSNCYLEGQSPLDAPGVGQAVSEEVRLIVTNWQWIARG